MTPLQTTEHTMALRPRTDEVGKPRLPIFETFTIPYVATWVNKNEDRYCRQTAGWKNDSL